MLVPGTEPMSGKGVFLMACFALFGQTPETPSTEKQPEETTTSVEDLDQMPGVGPKYRQLLRAARIKTIKDIAGYTPEILLANLLAVNQEENITKRPPTLANIEDWIEKAKNKE